MGKRTVLAGMLAAIGMFIWVFIAHEFLPLGEAGVKEMSNELPFLGAMHSTLGEISG